MLRISFYPLPWWEWFVLPGFAVLAVLYYFASSERRLGRRKASLLFNIVFALVVLAMFVWLVIEVKDFAGKQPRSTLESGNGSDLAFKHRQLSSA